jgi:hypothetical protein
VDEPEPEAESEPEPAEERAPAALSVVPSLELEEEEEVDSAADEQVEDVHPDADENVTHLPRGSRRWGLWELDRLVEDYGDVDPTRMEERRAVLYFLRDHAALDGSIPPEFEAVVLETFGDLIDAER